MTNSPPYKKEDQDGSILEIGDWVKIIGVPDLSKMSAEPLSECQPIFKYLMGKYKRIKGFDPECFAQFDFRIPGEKGFGNHTVWIEPYLLRKKK